MPVIVVDFALNLKCVCVRVCSVPNFLWCWLACDLFGKVQQGSPLSYQQPAKEKVQTLHNAPPPPSLPLQDYRLKPSECMFVFSRKQQLHMKSLEVSIEYATRDQSECADWYNVTMSRCISF